MKRKVELFANCKCVLSESPMWHSSQRALYWRGFEGEIFRKKMNTKVNDFERFPLNIGKIGSMVFTEGEEILLFAEYGKIWKWKPYTQPVLYRDFQKNLFNDVLCDSRGRIYCGMLASDYFNAEKRGKYGSFWRMDKNEFVCLNNKTSPTPNGIRISPQKDKLYFAVTDDNRIYSYDYDEKTGEIFNQKIFAENCFPDGIAVDDLGNVWVADCRCGRPVLCYNAKGELIEEIDVPVRRVISVAFGGEDRKTLFITTAHENEPRGEYDGGVFCVRTDHAGAAEYRYLLNG